ncbi:MAG: GDSL-type esterase/lipase family protein [Planctomycetota bacterium]
MTIRNAIQQQQASSIQGYWPFEDADQPSGGAIAAVIGSDLDVFGTHVYEVAGQEGNAVTLNGTSGYVFQGSPLGATINDHTICFWFNTTDTSGVMFSFGSESDNFPLYEISLTNGQISVFSRGGDTTLRYNVSGLGAGLNDGSWHFLALRHDGTNYIIQVDDVTLDTTEADAGMGGFEIMGFGARLRASKTEHIQVTVQHSAVWDVSLSDEELTNIFTGTSVDVPTNPVYSLPDPQPSARYLADPLQFALNAEDQRIIEAWADCSGDGHPAIAGDPTYGQSKPLFTRDVDGRPGAWCVKDDNITVRHYGFGVPASLTGRPERVAGFAVVTQMFERQATITRFLAAAGIRIEWSSDSATTAFRSPRIATRLTNELTTSMRREVIGYRMEGTQLDIFYNGQTFTFTHTSTEAGSDLSGGYIGSWSANGSSRFVGLIHEIVLHCPETAAGLPTVEEFNAQGAALMAYHDVEADPAFFVQPVGDSMANLGDGTAESPFGWADQIRPPVEAYQLYVDSIPGWEVSDALAVYSQAQGRRSVFGAENNIALILIGTNHVATTSQELADEVRSLWARYKSDGWKVVGGTIPPRNDDQPNILARIRGANPLLRAAAAAEVDYFIDGEMLLPNLLGTLVDPANHPLWNSDAVHPNAVGYALYSQMVNAELSKFIAQEFGTTQDDSSVDTSTASSVTMITDAQINQSIAAEITGQKIKSVSGDEGSVTYQSAADQIALAKYARRSRRWTPRGVLRSIRGGSIAPPSSRGN